MPRSQPPRQTLAQLRHGTPLWIVCPSCLRRAPTAGFTSPLGSQNDDAANQAGRRSSDCVLLPNLTRGGRFASRLLSPRPIAFRSQLGGLAATKGAATPTGFRRGSGQGQAGCTPISARRTTLTRNLMTNMTLSRLGAYQVHARKIEHPTEIRELKSEN